MTDERIIEMMMGEAKGIVSAALAKGEAIASEGYANATYAGLNDAVVTSDGPTESDGVITATLTAQGLCVPFIEFGNGVYRNPSPDTGGYRGSAIGVSDIGTYGKGFGSRSSWVYRDNGANAGNNSSHPRRKDGSEDITKNITHGNAAHNVLYMASAAMIRELGGRE